MRRLVVVAAMSAALLPLLLTTPVSAHLVDLHLRGFVDAVTPPVPGLLVTISNDDVQAVLVIDNETDEDVVLLSDDGQPILRITPEGVDANRNSPDWYRFLQPVGVPAIVPPGADADAPVDWEHFRDESRMAVHDRRVQPDDVRPPEGAATLREPVVLHDWTIPLRVGARDVTVTGQLSFVPVFGTIRAEVIDGGMPWPDVTVAAAVSTIGALRVDNRSGDDVIVDGLEGEPFLRIGPDGAFANGWSPTFQRDGRAADVDLDPAAMAAGEPQWVPLATTTTWLWADPRAATPYEQPPPALTADNAPVVLREWSLTLRRGDEQRVVTGRTRWLPDPEDDGGLGLSSQVTGLGLAVALVAVAAWRRTRSRDDDVAGPAA